MKPKKIKVNKSKILNLFGLNFQIWKVIEGYRISVDTKTTRYIFKPMPFWYIDKCAVSDLI